MLDFLSTVDARKWQDSNIRLRQPGTGIWFTDGQVFKSWLAADESKLWVYGRRTTRGLWPKFVFVFAKPPKPEFAPHYDRTITKNLKYKNKHQ